MARRLMVLLAIGMAITGLATVVAAVVIVRAVTRPQVKLVGQIAPPVTGGRPAQSPAEAEVQKQIEAQYKRMQDAIDRSDATTIDRIITPDFRLERLFGDRVFDYSGPAWKAYLLRVGPARQWPFWMNNGGVRIQQEKQTKVEVGPVTVKGDTATVVTTVIDTYRYTRIPAQASVFAEYMVTERDVWKRLGPSWRLKRLQVLKSRTTRESTLSQ
jgi:hypothetical protein